MNAFTLKLQDASHAEAITGVTSFVGEDASGSFGILAGHMRMMTILSVGLARFRVADGPWRYLALPGGVLYFVDDVLTVSTRRYLLEDDYQRISDALREQLLKEEEALHAMRQSLHRMEEEALRRLWTLNRREPG
jgi:F-type H+-transporting ATPase subunit epsilon